MPRTDINFSAPLVRKNKGKSRTTTTSQSAYTPASVKPGIRHVIEGRDNLTLNKTTTPGRKVLGQAYKNAAPDYHYGPTRTKSNQGEVDAALKGYKLEDEARSRLRTIPDADAARTAERKKAARRRMRGRLGTMLSGQRETLG